jgi:hypothetical protein
MIGSTHFDQVYNQWLILVQMVDDISIIGCCDTYGWMDLNNH